MWFNSTLSTVQNKDGFEFVSCCVALSFRLSEPVSSHIHMYLHVCYLHCTSERPIMHDATMYMYV